MLSATQTLTDIIEERRHEATRRLNPTTKATHGQFLTPRPVAEFMASLFTPQHTGPVRLLDAGAGIGSLTAAFVDAWLQQTVDRAPIVIAAYETDALLVSYLDQTLAECCAHCASEGVACEVHLLSEDFIAAGADQLFLAAPASGHFTHAILNPPYTKIGSDSRYRRLLRSIGVETVNLYAGFLAVAIKLLQPGGELVAIVPRSFCNGPYFRPFRELLLSEMAISSLHLFASRTEAFRDDAVLQENIILHAVRGRPQGSVILSQSSGLDFHHLTRRVVDFERIVHPSDPEHFIHLTIDDDDHHAVERMRALPCTLTDLGIAVSTGPVVDFRLATYLRDDPAPGTFPLIYPVHCRNQVVSWPLAGNKKPNAIADDPPVQKWLYPNGHYTVVRRFSSKEERRRVVAALHDPRRVPGAQIGFENHLNIFHHQRHGLAPELARGLVVYLNSTLVDVCFRQFSGHTQVNVNDLYALRYPDRTTLDAWGRRIDDDRFPGQEEIDAWMEQDLPQ